MENKVINMEIESIYLDKSFDNQLNNIEKLKWVPWVGSKYSTSARKTLILGESVYNWSPSDNGVQEFINRRDNTRRLQVRHAFNYKRKSNFVRNFEKAFYNKKQPTDDEKCNLWSSAIYHNLVLRMMKTKKHRPSYYDYYEGWSIVNSLITTLDVDYVIVYGLEGKKIDALRDLSKEVSIDCNFQRSGQKIGRCHPLTAKLMMPDKTVNFLFIRHPSSYFSWKKWSSVIQNHLITIKGQDWAITF